MITKTTVAKNVDDYIARFPKGTQVLLEEVRAAIKKAAPKAEEAIGYNMPAYKYFGVLAYFAGYERHIGFYPTASGIANFEKEISHLKSAKGSVQFPIDKPMPRSLITQIVRFKVKENETKSSLKRKIKK